MWDFFSDNGLRERRFIVVVCFFAMIRIFLLNAAYPVFTPVDEVQHFDTIVKHAQGQIFKQGNIHFNLNPWSAKMWVLYGSPEYMHDVPKDTVPPYRVMNDSVADATAKKLVGILPNHEIHSPPLYYFIAGQWLNIGNRLISNDGFLLYWLRFINVPFYGLLVWLTYLSGKKIFPEETALRIGLPMILAVFPNDIFFSLNSDCFSPLFCLIALYLLFRIATGEQSVLYYTFTGLAIAATLLVKLTNFPVFTVSVGIVMMLLYRRLRAKNETVYAWHFTACMIAALLPVLMWMWWNVSALGDVMGVASKMKVFAITNKPFPEWFNHPMFTIDGLNAVATNVNILIDSFWHGEVVWGMRTTAPYAADLFYSATSVLFITAACVKLYATRSNFRSSKYLIRLSSALLLILYVGFLMVLSIKFDFGHSHDPSRENPFFNKGRFIIGGLVPFLILYVDGLLYVLEKTKLKINPLVTIGAICLIVLTFSIISTYGIFGSAWNWFHLFL